MAGDRNFDMARKRLIGTILAFGLALFSALSAPALANDNTRIGSVTKQPLPRFVTLKGEEGNVRRGPSVTHRIDWVFTRRGMPLQVVSEFGNWRQVRDRDGAGGWMHHILLSRARSVIVQEDLMPLRSSPEEDAPIRARAEAGVIARLGPCENGYCRIQSGRTRGWASVTSLWGLTEAEVGVGQTTSSASN